ncbi:MAG: RidA family protein [Deltaproteobacteria bacterium]|nr:RidA family protein [Deltaproteobacteria bacterium]
MREICKLKSMPAAQYRYSSLIKAGPFYYTAGMIALDREGKLTEGGAFAQASVILETLLRVLSELEMDKSHLISARIYVTDMKEFPDVNRAWEEFFPESGAEPPVRTSIAAAALPLSARVEMEFILFKP